MTNWLCLYTTTYYFGFKVVDVRTVAANCNLINITVPIFVYLLLMCNNIRVCRLFNGHWVPCAIPLFHPLYVHSFCSYLLPVLSNSAQSRRAVISTSSPYRGHDIHNYTVFLVPITVPTRAFDNSFLMIMIALSISFCDSSYIIICYVFFGR